MKTVRCGRCGRDISIKKTVQMFDIAGSHAVTLCIECYYKELAQMQEEKGDKLGSSIKEP